MKYEIEIEKNPPGYSEGTWGYILRFEDESAAWDGGFNTPSEARDAGLRHAQIYLRGNGNGSTE